MEENVQLQAENELLKNKLKQLEDRLKGQQCTTSEN
jgi:regulator of replication initiation timing